jgi:hypothetical protein
VIFRKEDLAKFGYNKLDIMYESLIKLYIYSLHIENQNVKI